MEFPSSNVELLNKQRIYKSRICDIAKYFKWYHVRLFQIIIFWMILDYISRNDFSKTNLSFLKSCMSLIDTTYCNYYMPYIYIITWPNNYILNILSYFPFMVSYMGISYEFDPLHFHKIIAFILYNWNLGCMSGCLDMCYILPRCM